MKKITYNNLNCIFSFENICTQLNNFWINEDNIKKYNKIWLTIIVCNKYNKSYILIKNIPFYTSDYSDVVVVLRQVFVSSEILAGSRKDYLDNITFKCYFEKHKNTFSWNKFFQIVFIYIILILALYILMLIIILLAVILQWFLFTQVINEETLNIANNIINPSVICTENNDACINCIFDPFIKLFDKTGKYSSYFPSYFIPTKLEVDNQDFILLDYIYYNQYIILDYYTLDSKEYIRGLQDIIQQYKSLTDRTLQLYKSISK